MIWFGESWGAPICDPETHGKTPVGKPCLYCGTPIEPEDNGVMMAVVHANGSATLEAAHRLCFLETILPHGADCEHCRGLHFDLHAPECRHRIEGGNCDCAPGEDMRRLLDSKTTLAEVETMAERLGISRGDLEDIALRGLEHVKLLKQRRAAHNPGDGPGKRKAT